MKVELIIPIEELRGKLRQDGYYFRMYKGQQIVQKCPTKWKDTPARKIARELFAARYAGKHRIISGIMTKKEQGAQNSEVNNNV